jgi:hypothetical protein
MAPSAIFARRANESSDGFAAARMALCSHKRFVPFSGKTQIAPACRCLTLTA